MGKETHLPNCLLDEILLMERKILHHLACIKPCEEWDTYHINWLAGLIHQLYVSSQQGRLHTTDQAPEQWQKALTSALSVAALSVIDGTAIFHATWIHRGNL